MCISYSIKVYHIKSKSQNTENQSTLLSFGKKTGLASQRASRLENNFILILKQKSDVKHRQVTGIQAKVRDSVNAK